jgi:ABC-type polysaccharide/polyol phosphate export permease
VYQFNPLAAVVFATRDVLLEARAPAESLMTNLTGVSLATLAVGFLVFGKLKNRFADYL